ncbi:MAG: tandem-95 repeat protein [Planctomycetota bacterium]|nr:MAG: tandem-95 repeat protein [Planctomycetota bacterium]
MMKNRNGSIISRSNPSSGIPNSVKRKKLMLEALEGRRLLAGDVASFHNYLIAQDVNRDFNVSPLDALITINSLNAGQSGALPAGASVRTDSPLVDVNGDNHLSAIDALMIINMLNGEGEHNGQPDLTEFKHEFLDLNGQPLSSNQVVVGQIFQLRTSVRDPRGFTATGISAAYLDLAFDNGLAFDVAVGELQTVKFFVDTLDVSQTDSSFTLTLGSETTGPIGLFTAGGNPRSNTAVAAAMQSALEALPSVGAGNVSVIVDQVATNQDRENGIFTRYNFEVRFKGALSGQDLPLLVADTSNVKTLPGQTFEVNIAEVLAGDQSTPEAEARSFVFDPLYDFARSVTVTPTEFDEVGAASSTLPIPDPAEFKTLFTVPLVARQPGVITFTPNPAEESPDHDIIAFIPGSTDPQNPFGRVPPEQVVYGDPFAITVVADPTAPVAVDDTLTIAEDTSITLNGNVTLNDQVTAPRTLSVQSVAALNVPAGSTLVGTTFTPPTDFFGQATLTYVAVDSTGLTSNTATVTINITPVNDPPVANDDAFTVIENSTAADPDNQFDVLANDNGGPNEGADGIRVVSVGASSQGGTVQIINGGLAIAYTPPSDFIGVDTFTYEIQDAGGLTAMATVTVTVDPGVVPRARTDFASGPEGQPIANIDVLANDRVNPGAQAILISASNGAHGTVTIDDNGTPGDMTDDTVTYTPNDPDFFGTDTFTYVMNDTAGTGEDSTGTVSITITDVNDPPVLTDDLASTDEDMVLTIPIATLLSNDSPGAGEGPGSAGPQTLTLTSVNALTVGGGSVAIQGNAVVYTPAADFNGTFLFEYTATDNGQTPGPLSGTATVTVTVNPVNDPPVAGDDNVTATEDTPAVYDVSTLLANDVAGPPDEVASQTLTVTGVSSPSAAGGTVTLSGTQVTYTPAADFFGNDSFTYTISDGAGGTATGTVFIAVAPVNDAPIPGDDNLVAFKDRTAIIPVADLLANDLPGPANESDQTLSIVSVTPGADINGTLVLNGDGTISYTPTPGYIGPASFQYTVQDSGPAGNGNVNTAVGTVRIDVKPFVPTDISGVVWVDETGDGVVDEAERRLGGIRLMISGTSLGEAIMPMTIMTLADGSYHFRDMPPGEYIVQMMPPAHFIDGMDVPGPLGDGDLIDNQFTIRIPEPGGSDASGYNFALQGVDAATANRLASIDSAIAQRDPTAIRQGLYVALGPNNALQWTALLDGFGGAQFAEVVLSNDGNNLTLSYVDSTHRVFSTQLGRREFMKTTDPSGNTIVRIFGEVSDFNFHEVNLDAPPASSHANYLASIDAIFDQEGW